MTTPAHSFKHLSLESIEAEADEQIDQLNVWIAAARLTNQNTSAMEELQDKIRAHRNAARILAMRTATRMLRELNCAGRNQRSF